ncbi:MAG: hypothetical protein ACE5HI_18005 [bacterium]
MNVHKSLNQHAKGILSSINIERLRGVTATWNEKSNTLNLSYFFNGEPTEEEIEEASIVSTDIMAGLPIAYIEEKYINLEYPNPLPESEFWVCLNTQK